MLRAGQTNEGFIVYKGSHITLVNDGTVLESIKRRKEKVSLDENGNITEDQFFTSHLLQPCLSLAKMRTD